VYDKQGQDILSPLVSVSDLRELGVTLYLQLHADREHIPDTTVVYFVQPTERNVKKICQDIQDQKYDKYQLNFISRISREQLELLAQSTLESQSVNTIEKVYDMYSNFICLESDFFMLRQQESESLSYHALNGPSSDEDLNATVDEITDSLFCVCVSMGVVPVIRCSPGCLEIAQRLDKKIRENLKGRNGLFTDTMSASGSFQRPVLALLDRHADMSTILHHSWTYQSTMHDLMDFKLNRVTVGGGGGDGGATKAPGANKSKTYDLDSKNDQFWDANRFKQWPEVAQEVDKTLKEVGEEEASLKNIKTLDGGGSGAEALSANTAKIREAVHKLPMLMQQKTQLGNHMSLLGDVIEIITARGINDYFDIEEQIMNQETVSVSKVCELLGKGAKGSSKDQMRLFLIYMVEAKPKAEDIEKCKKKLAEKASEGEMAAIKHIEEMQKMRSMTTMRRSTTDQQAAPKTGFLGNFDSGLFSTFGSGLKSGLSKMMVTNSESAATQIVDALMENRETELTKDFLFLDPKVVKPSGVSSTVPKGRAPFDEGLVFMVGGGNFNEYQNIVQAMKSKGKSVVYGCSELMSPEQFLDQMSALGRGESVAPTAK